MVIKMNPPLEKLLFKREQFPVAKLAPYEDDPPQPSQKYKYLMDATVIPPYHPSMKKGIPLQLIPEIIEDVLNDTLADIKGVIAQAPWHQYLLDDVVFETETGKVISRHRINQTSGRINLFDVPFIHNLYADNYAEKKTIGNWSNIGADKIISIDSTQGSGSFLVPKEVSFSKELMQEYEMQEKEEMFGNKKMISPNRWETNNLRCIDSIFYKNLVIALDNAVVKRKYTSGLTQ